MELTEFNSLIVKDSNEAKNFFSFLIGNLKHESDHEKALLAMYDSFSIDIKKDEKIFAPIFLKFFNIFEINDNNISYYKKFEGYWTDSAKQLIKQKNKHWSWEETVYKNSLEFIKTLDTYIYKYGYNNSKEIIQFLEKSNKEIERLIQKDKNKFLENFKKNDCINRLINIDYQYMKKFCELYNFNIINLIKESIEKSGYKMDLYISAKDKNNQFEDFILDILNNNPKDLLKSSNFFEFKGSNFYNILDLFIILMHDDKISASYLIARDYPEELSSCIKGYIGKSPSDSIDITEQKVWNEVWDELSYRLKKNNRRTFENLSLPNLEPLIKNMAEKIKKLYLFSELNKLPEKTNQKKIKI